MATSRNTVGALVVTALTLTAAGCGGGGRTAASSSSPSSRSSAGPATSVAGGLTHAAAVAYARSVNLRAGDLPGAVATSVERERPPPSAAAREFARCAGAPDPRKRIVDLSSAKFRPRGATGTISSSVEVMPSAALARASFQAAASPRGRECVSKLLPDLIGRKARGSYKLSHLSIRPISPPGVAGRSFGYRIAMNLAVPRGGPSRPVPLYFDVFEQLHGAAEVGLDVVGVLRPPSRSLERWALATLSRRAQGGAI